MTDTPNPNHPSYPNPHPAPCPAAPACSRARPMMAAGSSEAHSSRTAKINSTEIVDLRVFIMACFQKRLRHIKSGVPGFLDSATTRGMTKWKAQRYAVSTAASCCAHPCHTARVPLSCCARALSCCAQSQHPERPVEPSKPGVPGFRDYARNDEVEDPTLCGEHRDVTLRALVLP